MRQKEQKSLEVENVSVYDRVELIDNARAIFGEYPEIVVGALHGNDKEQLTLAEVKTAIKEFKSRKV